MYIKLFLLSMAIVLNTGCQMQGMNPNNNCELAMQNAEQAHTDAKRDK